MAERYIPAHVDRPSSATATAGVRMGDAMTTPERLSLEACKP
jgi:hypothetical protein